MDKIQCKLFGHKKEVDYSRGKYVENFKYCLVVSKCNVCGKELYERYWTYNYKDVKING